MNNEKELWEKSIGSHWPPLTTSIFLLLEDHFCDCRHHYCTIYFSSFCLSNSWPQSEVYLTLAFKALLLFHGSDFWSFLLFLYDKPEVASSLTDWPWAWNIMRGLQHPWGWRRGWSWWVLKFILIPVFRNPMAKWMFCLSSLRLKACYRPYKYLFIQQIFIEHVVPGIRYAFGFIDHGRLSC